MKSFSDLNIKVTVPMSGEKIKISKVINREFILHDFRIADSQYSKNKTGKCLTIQIELDGESRVVFTGSDILIRQIQQVSKEDFPLKATIIQQGEHYEFK